MKIDTFVSPFVALDNIMVLAALNILCTQQEREEREGERERK